MRKSDFVLLAAILAVGAIVFVLNTVFQEAGSVVKVVSGREVYGVYNLRETREIKIEDNGRINVIVIANNKAEMQHANCPGGDCMGQQAISMAGQSIVCLPNKILLMIEGGGDKLDSVTY